MNDLVKYLVESILQEDNISKVVVIYSGRFQPAAKHHVATFRWLQDKFGKDDTYVATSDKVELPKSPLNFEEKQNIWAKHGVDSSKVVKVKSPYKAEEILSKYDPNTTAVIFVFGEKDAERLAGGTKANGQSSYFQPYEENKVLDNYTKHGYFLVAPHVSLKVKGRELDGTAVRELLGDKRISPAAKKALFKEIFGWYDDVIYNKIVPKFESASKNINEKINEKLSVKKKVNEHPDTVYVKGKEIATYSTGDATFIISGENSIYSEGSHRTHSRLTSLIEETPDQGHLPNKIGVQGDYNKLRQDYMQWKEDKRKQGVRWPCSRDFGICGRLWFRNKKEGDICSFWLDKESIIKNWKYVKHFLSQFRGVKAFKFDFNNSNYDGDLTPASELESGIHDKEEKTLSKAEVDALMKKQHLDPNAKAKLGKGMAGSVKLGKVATKAGFKTPADFNRTRSIDEGGNAFPKLELSALKKENLNSTIKRALEEYGLGHLEFSPIGNISKPILNDIDIAIDTNDLVKALKLDATDKNTFFESLDQYFKSTGRPFALSKGINIFHIVATAITSTGEEQPFIDQDGLPIKNKTPFVQIDVMMGTRKWREKHFSGAADSKYKAIVRNMLLSDIASQIIIEENGVKSKFLLNPSEGFFLVTFEDLPNGKRKELLRKLVSNNMDDVAKTFFGDKYTFSDINTFEKLYTLLMSPDFKFKKFLNNILSKFKEYLASVKGHAVPTLNEGGIAGHMSHPYEDLGLSFHDMKEIVRRSLGGNLHIEKAVTEKLDGQNFSITWHNGQIKGARNKTHMKNFGDNALDLNQLVQFFNGRPNIQKAFTESLTTLSNAIKSLSEKQRFKIFANGHRFMSFEILYPETQNVIPYNQRKLIFHNTFEVDQEGNKIGVGEKDSARMLSGMIRQKNQHKGSGFDIQGPQVVDIVKDNMSHVKERKIIGDIEQIQSKHGLPDNATNKDFLQKEWTVFIVKTAHKMKYNIPSKVVELLSHRFSSQDKSVKLVQVAKMIDSPKFLSWLKSFDDQQQLETSKKMRWPIEKIFLELGTDVLENANNLVLASDDEAAKKIQVELQNTLDYIKQNKDSIDSDKLKKLKFEFERLNSIGGLKNIIPSEGIVFSYKNHLYKLVGKFPAINQILGIFKYT